jgi:hypothetical protein
MFSFRHLVPTGAFSKCHLEVLQRARFIIRCIPGVPLASLAPAPQRGCPAGDPASPRTKFCRLLRRLVER